MLMSNAWETTQEDVVFALSQLGYLLPDSDLRIEKAYDLVRVHGDRIASSTLYGDDMDSQFSYAIQEIAAVLKEFESDWNVSP